MIIGTARPISIRANVQKSRQGLLDQQACRDGTFDIPEDPFDRFIMNCGRLGKKLTNLVNRKRDIGTS